MTNKQKRYLKVKRINSLVAAFIYIPTTLPLFLLILLINTIAMKGHPFFVQERYGEHREIFKIYKFQSFSKDGHISLWGRFIRFTSLDELPQLYNIIKGDMNIIGPRPLSILEEDIDILRKEMIPSPYEVKPGLTGYAQIKFRPSLKAEEKANNDHFYISNFSLSLDIKILLITIFKVVPITIHSHK